MGKTITDNFDVLIIIGMLGAILFVISFMLIYIRNRNKMFRQQRKMQQRADQIHAKLAIESAPGKGTRVCVIKKL